MLLYISYKIRNIIYNNDPSYDPYYIRVMRVFLHSIYYTYLTKLLTVAQQYYKSSKYNNRPRHFIILLITTTTCRQCVTM